MFAERFRDDSCVNHNECKWQFCQQAALEHNERGGQHQSQVEDRMMSALFNDTVKIIDQSGTTLGELGAVVDKNRIITQDASLPVEVGDTIERDLPHGRKETFSVTHVQFTRGLRGMRDFYEITTGDPNSSANRSDEPGVSVYVSDSPHARVNFNSIDNSNNVVNIQAREVFQRTRHLLETSVEDAGERALLLQSVDEMEEAHESGDFVTRYKQFMGLAANHMAVLAPIGAALASLL